MTGSRWLLVAALVVLATLLALPLAPTSGPPKPDERALRREKWDGAMVYRICRDGSYVYRLRNGEFWTMTSPVADAERVCQ